MINGRMMAVVAAVFGAGCASGPGTPGAMAQGEQAASAAAVRLAAGPKASPAAGAAPMPMTAQVAAAAEEAAPQEPRLDLRRGRFVQGGLTFWMTDPGATVLLNGEPVSVDRDGHFVLGFGRDYDGRADLKVTGPDGGTRTQTINVAPREFRISRIDGLQENKVNPYSPEDLAQIREESAAKKRARANPTDEPYWRSGFNWPIRGRISSPYGAQRILNGTPKRPHSGTDVAAPAGTSPLDFDGRDLRAPATGKVTMAREGMFFEGGLILIDHGQNLESALLHLSRVDVNAGQIVTKGEVIGAVGATGRATGPHLHWSVNWKGVPMDPELLVPPMVTARN